MMRRILTAAVTAALAVSPMLVAPAVGAADEPPPPGLLSDGENPPPGTVGHRQWNSWNSYIEIVGVRENQLNPRYLAKCGVDSPDQTCTINRTRTVTNTITADFGATVSGVTAGIGVLSSEAIAIQIGCQSPPMDTGQEYVAFPTEKYFYYRVVSDDDAFASDVGQYISDGVWEFSPVAMTAAFDEGFRCRVRQQPT